MDATRYTSDIAFTPIVKAVQARKGSRKLYARMERTRPWAAAIPPELARFIEAQTSVFLATANAVGQPYIQHRGGPAGFLRVLDDHTLGFADFVGNRQYITQGNLAENPKACLFLIDYAQRQRVKIWGEARVIEDDPALTEALMPKGYRARPEQVIVFKIAAWDTNCPQHIPQKFDAADVAAAMGEASAKIEERDKRIADLEAELAKLKGEMATAAAQ